MSEPRSGGPDRNRMKWSWSSKPDMARVKAAIEEGHGDDFMFMCCPPAHACGGCFACQAAGREATGDWVQLNQIHYKGKKSRQQDGSSR